MTSLDRFLARWSASGDAERANKDSFLNELCDVLGVERPHPKTGFAERDLYVFERDVARTRAGAASLTLSSSHSVAWERLHSARTRFTR